MRTHSLTHPWRYVAVDSLALPIVSEQLCLVPGVKTLLPNVLLHYLHVLVWGGKVFPHTQMASMGVHGHTCTYTCTCTCMVGRESFHGTKELFNLHVPPLHVLVLKARHLSGSAFCWVDIHVHHRFAWAGSEMVSPRFQIGYGRWTYWTFIDMNARSIWLSIRAAARTLWEPSSYGTTKNSAQN